MRKFFCDRCGKEVPNEQSLIKQEWHDICTTCEEEWDNMKKDFFGKVKP